jgi:hypothetical protein
VVVIRITRCFFGVFGDALCGGELGDGLGALRHGVLGQLPGQDEAHRRLDLARGHGGLLVVARQLGGLGGDLLEDVVDEGVEDGHGLGADARVGVHLRVVVIGSAANSNRSQRCGGLGSAPNPHRSLRCGR